VEANLNPPMISKDAKVEGSDDKGGKPVSVKRTPKKAAECESEKKKMKADAADN